MIKELSDEDEMNLRFLLESPSHVLEGWWNTASPEDTRHAQSLLEIARLRVIDIVVERHGTPLAKAVLAKVYRNKS